MIKLGKGFFMVKLLDLQEIIEINEKIPNGTQSSIIRAAGSFL